MLKGAQRIPGATYRLQLRKEFPFAAVEAMAPHLARMGISDVYLSPILFSNPGSTHGYDVADYRRIDPELGGREGMVRLHAALRQANLGVLLDFVPNHMGINGPGPFNKWWQDVLENGQASPHARFFDINWNAKDGRARVLVPILDDHYGRVLEAGRLAVVEEGGRLSIAYGEMRFPISAESRAEHATLNPQHPTPNALAEINGKVGEPRSFDRLDALIERQHYRLAYWKAGAHETNYRRFFAIDSLIGVRIEIPEVFNECHALLGKLLRDGLVSGVRVDHIDGLFDPAGYLERLQALRERADGAEAVPPGKAGSLGGTASVPSAAFYVVVEKILGRNEELPSGWQAHGSTGYEFIAQMAGLMVEARAEGEFTRIYADFTGSTASYASKVYEKKWMVLDEMFANAVAGLAEGLGRLPEADRRWRDLTVTELTAALREMIAQLSIYRTYRRGAAPMDEFDRREIERACAEAARRTPRMGRQPFEFIRDVLVGDYPGPEMPRELREFAGRWTMTLQQYTGAVMAKAVEDTAFYTYNRFVGMNEVGCDPEEFGRPVTAFHAANAARLAAAPHSLLATSTHDTKFGEDARARLYALSEIAGEWKEWVAEWRALNRRHKSLVDGESAPDANEEYRIYQVMLAALELGQRSTLNTQRSTFNERFRNRMKEYVRKAVNEAKRHTAWANPNEAWIAAGDRFVDGMLDPESGKEFLESFWPRARRLAHLGMVNSLAQVVLKICSPGVPDFYQGAESWLLHLVDPDNRGIVDGAELEKLAAAADAPLAELLRDWPDGRIKLRVTRDLLRFRGAHPALFQEGSYTPVESRGAFAENIVAFVRGGAAPGQAGSGKPEAGGRLLVVVPRLAVKLGCPPLGLVWEDTLLRLDGFAGLAAVGTGVGAPGYSRSRWKDVVTGREFPAGGELPVRELFCELPFAVLGMTDGTEAVPPERTIL